MDVNVMPYGASMGRGTQMGTISIYGKNFLKTFLSKTGDHEPFLKIEKQITSIINMTTINNFSCNVTIYLTMYLTFILMKYVICL